MSFGYVSLYRVQDDVTVNTVENTWYIKCY